MRISARFWAVTVVTAATIFGALWEAIGPFSVSDSGQTLACGSPFLGRYMSPGDAMATLSYMCHQQAPTRRVATFVLAGVALLVSVIALVVLRAKKERTADRSIRGLVAAEATGAAAALLVIAGGVLAIARAAG
ncbi:MAG: hypothetical protein ACREOE_04270 [Gemmatimonadales bacterium]